jgi:hypothetical protein
MERKFYKDDFERLLQEKADQYKMYPSDRVWNGIYEKLHGRRKWMAGALALLFLLGGLVTVYFLEPGTRKLRASEQTHINAVTAASAVTNPTPIVKPTTSLQLPMPVNAINGRPLVSDNEEPLTLTERISTRREVEATVYSLEPTPDQYDPVAAAPVFTTPSPAPAPVSLEVAPAIIHAIESFNAQVAAERKNEAKNNEAMQMAIAEGMNESVIVSPDALAGTDHNALVNTTENKSTKKATTRNKLVDSRFLHTPSAAASGKPAIRITEKPSRWAWEVYAAPSVSYRRLLDSDKKSNNIPDSINVSVPFSVHNYTGVENIVNHRPAMGLEFGVNLLYAVSERVSLKVGAQVNYTRYDIRAFTANPEKTAIRLGFSNFSSPHDDSITTYPFLRNFTGNSEKWLQNRYIQVSVPIGADVRLLGNKKLQLHVAGSIQPTYVAWSNAYIITPDFTNYTQEQKLLRRWNFNGSFETYLSYKTNGINVHFGPEIRSQFLSSYTSKYAVKEKIMSLGARLGIGIAIPNRKF